MERFGWDYPPGADNDNAPWNQGDYEGEPCPATWGDDDLPCEYEAGHDGEHRTTDPNAPSGFPRIKWGD